MQPGGPFQRYYFMKENVFLMQTPIEGGVCQKVLLMLASTDFLGDRNIVTDCRSSHAEEVFESLLDKYADMVFKIAFARTNNSHDAEDIMQEVFVRYIKSSPQFENPEHEKAWFIRVTINLTKSLLTSSWFRRTTELKDNLYVAMKEKSEVYYAVAALPKNMRTVIHLYYYENYKVDEIAEMLGRSSSYVKSILMRARKKLKAALGDTFETVENADK